MTPEQQKQIAHILNRLQNGAVIQMGPLAEINYGTFADVRQFVHYFLFLHRIFVKNVFPDVQNNIFPSYDDDKSFECLKHRVS